MSDHVRVMLEQGRKRTVACAFDWPGWDRSSKAGDEAALAVLEAYRPRYAPVATRAGLADEFAAAGELEVVERLPGTGMADFYGVSGQITGPERAQMTAAECDRKVALLEAAWATFDAVAARVSPELRKGPRGGGRDRDRIVRHVNGSEMLEFAKKVGVSTPLEALDDPARIQAHREAFVTGIREHNARGPAARTWTVQFVIRRCAWHMLDHAWEMEDRDLTSDG